MPRVAALWALVVLARGGLCTSLNFPWMEILEHVKDVSDTEMGKVVEMKFIDQSQCQEHVVAKQIRAREGSSVAKPHGSIATQAAKASAMREICYAYLLSSKTDLPSVAVYDAMVVDVGVPDKREGPPQLFSYLMAHGGRDVLDQWGPMGPLYEGPKSSFTPKSPLIHRPKVLANLRRSKTVTFGALTMPKTKADSKVKLALGAALFYQVVSGLKVMQGLGLTHRDVKEENLLVTAFGPSDEDLSIAPERAWRVSFADFGMMVQGTSLPDQVKEGVFGTLEMMAPEYMRGHFCMGCTDVWAAGVVLHDLTFGHGSFFQDAISLKEKLSLKTDAEAVSRNANAIQARKSLAAALEPMEWWHNSVLRMLQWTLKVDATERMANFDKVLNEAHFLARAAAEKIGRDFAEWTTPPSKGINKACFKSMNQVNSVVGILEKKAVADCLTWRFNY